MIRKLLSKLTARFQSNHSREASSIPDEEPIFILRGRNALALNTLYHFIDSAEKMGERAGITQEEIDRAWDIANHMQEFQNDHAHSIVLEGQSYRNTYQG